MTPIHLGISTCPNDTFAFHGILERRVDLRGLEVGSSECTEVTIALIVCEHDDEVWSRRCISLYAYVEKGC